MTDFLQRLPLELLSKIISHLGFRDIQNSLFISKYFFNAITSTPFSNGIGIGKLLVETLKCDNGKSVEILPQSIIGGGGYTPLKLTPDMKFHLNVLTNQGNIPIERLQLEFQQNDDYIELLQLLLFSYKIKYLYLNPIASEDTFNILSTGKFQSLTKLQLVTTIPLDLNTLESLATSAFNLQSLVITCNKGLKDDDYTGTQIFTNLARFSLNSTHISHLSQQGISTQEVAIQKIKQFLSTVPTLTHLSLKGYLLFQNSSATEFLQSLPNLEYFEFHRKGYYSSQPLEVIPANNNKLKTLKLYTQGRIYGNHQPLSQIETFDISGASGIPGNSWYDIIEFYGIGRNLKTLYVEVNSKSRKKPLLTNNIWSKLPNLEQLIATEEQVDIKDFHHFGQQYCNKLKLVCFKEFKKDDENNYQIELIPKHIKDLYLNKKLPENEVNYLINNGINVYNANGHKYQPFS